MSSLSRYVVGIDLGTSNIAVAYLDMEDEAARPRIFPVTQIIAEGERDERQLLPSFAYLPDDNEIAAGSLDLPWATGRDFCVGALARKNASRLPGKTISSAKSWLCAATIDRLAPVLPWNRRNPERQLSPVGAARIYLEHIRDAWNHTQAGADPAARLEHQDIILTVPASFDVVARELTVRAAREAGLQVVLLEEPQAAFYAWLQERGEQWRDAVNAGDRVLVCDIGGGTTDFSLIEVQDDAGNLTLQRIAVGEHILLGGDNMDLTLAYTVARRLQEQRNIRLDTYQIAGLTHACREAKEILFGNPDAPPRRLTVLGRGSSVIGGTISAELSRQDVDNVLIEGFLPPCALGATPVADSKAGLRAFGLQYASDPAVTRHLSAFLSRNAATRGELPVAILFNGGVTKAAPIRGRLAQALAEWLPDTVDLGVLTGADPDLAVARGACWYGNVRRGNAIRIKAGCAHSCYIGIESSMPAVPGFEPPLEALCVAPFGMEEGTEADIPFSGLGLVVGETTEFKFFAAAERQGDQPGILLPDTEAAGLRHLPPLIANLPADSETTPAGTLVPVRLKVVLSEIGTLQVWCLEDGGDRRWKLEYELRTVELDDAETAAAEGTGA